MAKMDTGYIEQIELMVGQIKDRIDKGANLIGEKRALNEDVTKLEKGFNILTKHHWILATAVELLKGEVK